MSIKIKNSRYIYIFLIFAAVALLLEVTVFNFRHWESAGYEPQELEITDIGSGLEDCGDGRYSFTGESNSFIEFRNINTEIKNLYLNFDVRGMDRQLITLYVTDEANMLYYKLPQRELASDVERSRYIKMNTSGKSTKLAVEFVPHKRYDLDMTEKGFEGEQYYIKPLEVVINKPVPFDFIPERVAAVLAVFVLMYIFRYGTGCFNAVLDLKKHRQKAILALVILADIVFVSFIYAKNLRYFVWDRGVYTNLADSLLSGRFDITALRASHPLLNMQNPYDNNYRDVVAEGRFAWDYALFNGKYYVYFGIVPCLLLFVPAKALFGYSMPVNMAVSIFMYIYIFVAYRFVYVLITKFYKKASFVMYLLSAKLLLFCGAVSHCMQRNDLYVIPIITALIFTLSGLTLWLNGVDENGAVKSRLKLFFGALCMALVAGCRPQFVIGSFFALPIFWRAVFKKGTNKGAVLNMIIAALPYAVAAAGLMYYNYARFGSVTDFGSTYNLTTNDLTHRGWDIDRLGYGLFTYLVQPLSLSCDFPFLEPCLPMTRYMGYTMMENMRGGLLCLTPAMLMSGFICFDKVRKDLKKRGLLLPLVMCFAFVLAVAAADIEMGGIVLRYGLDFAWLLIIPAVICTFSAAEVADESDKKRVCFAFSLLVLISLLINTLLVFVRYRTMSMDYSNPSFFYSLMYAVEFWL